MRRADSTAAVLAGRSVGAVGRAGSSLVLLAGPSRGVVGRADASAALASAGPAATSLSAPIVTDVAYSAIHGATTLSCTTDRAARVRFKMTTTGLADAISAWSAAGTAHAGLVCQTAGGRTWTLHVSADATEGPGLDWQERGEIAVPARGDPAGEGDLPELP